MHGHNCPYRNAGFAVTAAAVGLAVWYFWKKGGCCAKKCANCKVNPGVDKSNSKVVHNVDIEDIGDKAVFCRCWRSKKFPHCDGSHNKFNEDTGDNVGPLIVKKK